MPCPLADDSPPEDSGHRQSRRLSKGETEAKGEDSTPRRGRPGHQ